MTTIIVEIELPDVDASDLDVKGEHWFPDPENPENIIVGGRYLPPTMWAYPDGLKIDCHVFKFVGIKDDIVSEAVSLPPATYPDGINNPIGVEQESLNALDNLLGKGGYMFVDEDGNQVDNFGNPIVP